MAQPALSSFAQSLYESLGPLAYADEQNQWALALYCQAIAQMFQEVEDLARDSVDTLGNYAPGWSGLLDINRTPSEALGWLAQFVGVTLQVGLDDTSQRARIKSTDGWKRGTPAALVGAARQYLTGAQVVILRERDTDPYKLTVVTYTSQTPDSGKVRAALLSQKPAGLVLTYNVLPGQDYQLLLDHHALYSDVYSSYASYQGIVTDQPGT